MPPKNNLISYLGLSFLFFLPSLFWIVVLFNFHDIATDGIHYVTIGQNLFATGQYISPYGLMPDWVQPPLYPFLTGIFTLFLPSHWSGILVDMLSLFLLLYLIYRFASLELELKYPWLPVFLLFANPLIILICSQSLTEPLFVFLHFGLFLILYQIFIQNKIEIRSILLAGLLAALLVLTRPEGIISALFFFILLIWKRKSRALSLVFLVIFVIVMLPYGLFIKSTSGHFNLVPKVSFNKRLSLVVKNYLKQHPTAGNNLDQLNHLAWFAYDPDNKDLYSSLIMDDGYYQQLKEKVTSDSNDLVFLFKRLRNNIIEALRVLFASRAVPLVYLIFLLTGVIVLFRKSPQLMGLMGLWLIPSTYFLISHVEERFFFVFLPYFVIVATLGVEYLISKFSGKYLNFIFPLVVVVFLANSALYYQEIYQYKIERNGYYEIARLLNKTLVPGTAICTIIPQITFWGEYQPLRLPICTPEQLREYLTSKRVLYLLLGNEVYSLRKDLIPVYEKRLLDEFRFITSLQYGDLEFHLFKLVTIRNLE